jgi:hypothetical protein
MDAALIIFTGKRRLKKTERRKTQCGNSRTSSPSLAIEEGENRGYE